MTLRQSLASIRRHLTYANAMASIAVFIALGGGAYAAVQVNGKNIKPRSIAGKKLKNNTLSGKQINERRLGQVPRAARAQFATKAGSAGTAASAGVADSATSATRADTATTATRATRATTADTATTATNATSAANADNAAALAGAPPSAYLVSCPATTTLYGGVCWDDASRTAAGWIAASDTCGELGGRLPTLSELVAYAQQPGTPVTVRHWSSDVIDLGGASPTVATSDATTHTGDPGSSSFAYRCVFYRTNGP
jgi:hypothetical protein